MHFVTRERIHVDRIATAMRPTLFAYQFLYELEPTR